MKIFEIARKWETTIQGRGIYDLNSLSTFHIDRDLAEKVDCSKMCKFSHC